MKPKLTCCGKHIKPQKGKSESKGDYVYFKCPECGRSGIGKTQEQAEKEFRKSTTMAIKTLAPIGNKQSLFQWAEKNLPVLLDRSAQFIDKPATKRMIEKNIRYISNLSGYSWDKVWKSPEGQESISHAFSESLYYAATLPEMGSIVPYGTTAEFIPSVECFRFALETGKGAPFVDIEIFTIHENDQHKKYRKNGNLVVDIEYGTPRGDLLQVVVMATKNDTNKIIGEIYDEPYLLEKARHHSPSYRQFLIEKEYFQKMKTEGKLKMDEMNLVYMEKPIKKKDGSTWDKKTYEHDIKNPYDGPDRVQMLIKSAGKTFFRPYMKVRNAAAMADEWNGDDIEDEITRNQAADNVLSSAQKQFNTNSSNIKDAEIVTDDEPASEIKKGGEIDKKDLKNNEGELFNEDEINNL